MASYERDSVDVSYGATSALQDPDIEKTFTSTPASPTQYKHVRLSVGTSEETIDLSEFTTIQCLFIKNHDATNYVLAKGRVVTTAATALTVSFVDSGTTAADTITSASNFLTNLYVKAGDYVVVTGSASNNTTFGPLTAAVAGTLTVPTAQCTAEAGIACNLAAYSPFTLRLEGADAAWTKITNVSPADDLILIAKTAACTVEVIAVGT